MPYKPFHFYLRKNDKEKPSNWDYCGQDKPSALFLSLHSFTGMALCGLWRATKAKEVLYWGGHTLVNSPSLTPPLRLWVCTYLVLSNWQNSELILNSNNPMLSTMHDKQRETLQSRVMKETKIQHLFIFFFEQDAITFH